MVVTWGNLTNRMLSFAYKRFDGVVPEPGELYDEDRALLEKVEARFQTVGDLLQRLQVPGGPFGSLRPAPREPWGTGLGEALALAREAAVAKQLPS